MDDLEEQLRQKILRWFGHIIRRDEDVEIKKVYITCIYSVLTLCHYVCMYIITCIYSVLTIRHYVCMYVITCICSVLTIRYYVCMYIITCIIDEIGLIFELTESFLLF